MADVNNESNTTHGRDNSAARKICLKQVEFNATLTYHFSSSSCRPCFFDHY